jgi:hypothetical protein
VTSWNVAAFGFGFGTVLVCGAIQLAACVKQARRTGSFWDAHVGFAWTREPLLGVPAGRWFMAVLIPGLLAFVFVPAWLSTR